MLHQHDGSIPLIIIARGEKTRKQDSRGNLSFYAQSARAVISERQSADKWIMTVMELLILHKLIKRASGQEEQERRDESHVHQARLDNLSANGLRRFHMTAYGSCFSEAASTRIENATAFELRNCQCDFLEDSFPTFLIPCSTIKRNTTVRQKNCSV